MAQALTIKIANTAMKTIGDIIPGGIFEDTHIFSEHELLEFNVVKIAGTCAEVTDKLNAIRVPIERAYRAATTEWSRIRPEEKEVWLDIDDKWYFLEAGPKYIFSTSLLSGAELTILETATTGLERDVIYQKMVVNPGVWDEKNIIEVIDLNRITAEL